MKLLSEKRNTLKQSHNTKKFWFDIGCDTKRQEPKLTVRTDDELMKPNLKY